MAYVRSWISHIDLFKYNALHGVAGIAQNYPRRQPRFVHSYAPKRDIAEVHTPLRGTMILQQQKFMHISQLAF